MSTSSHLASPVVQDSSSNLCLAGMKRFVHVVRDFNFFSANPVWSSSLTFREQIQSTRLFLLFICLSLLIVLGYSSWQVHTYEVTLANFSLTDFERLEKLYPNTIHAPCTEISVGYNQFLDYSPRFHQVCQSDFVKSEWISSLYLPNATSHNILDFRTFAFAHFRSLRLLCRISRRAITDILQTFNSTHLVHRYLYSRLQFDEIASVLSNNLQQNVVNDEKRTGQTISTIIAQNRLFSALRTNSYIQSTPGSRTYMTYNAVYFNTTTQSACDCRLNANQCTYPAGIDYNWTISKPGMAARNDPPPKYQIPGLFAGCLPLDAMRQSTLQCLYDQICVDYISLQPQLFSPKVLNLSLTRFPLNKTIGSIFDEALFVETWQNRSSYEKYFSACSPRSLSYSYQRRFHLGTIVTISLSAFGGLVVLWQLITPVFIQIHSFIRKRPTPPPEHTQIELAIISVPPRPINQVLVSHVHRTIHTFNLFPAKDKTNKAEERLGVLTTRVYIFVLFFCLIIFAIGTSLTKDHQIRTITHPTLDQFEELSSLNTSTLNCPCSHFSMSYARVMSLSPRYHSICTSVYLHDDWLAYFGRVEIDMESVGFLTTDFRISGQSFFDLTRILCRTANETIGNALKVFLSNRLVTMNTLSSKQFALETETRLKQFEEQTISSFVHLIEMIRSLIQSNQLAEELWTNLGPSAYFDNQTEKWLLKYRPRDFYTNSCSCAYSNQCFRPVGFYFQNDTIRSKPFLTVPGLVLSCYPIDSLLLSTYECFYDQQCVQFLLDYYDFDVVNLVIPLNNRTEQVKALPWGNSRFAPNTTIKEIFSQLFVEDWSNASHFKSYYQRCAPTQCTYMQSKRFDLPYLFAITLGFYGTLTSILEIILPVLIHILMKIFVKNSGELDTLVTVFCLQRMCNLGRTMDSSPRQRKYLYFRKKLQSLNFFASDSSSINTHEERIATRLYIFSLLIGLSIVILYSGPLSDQKKSIIIRSPSLTLLNDLHSSNHSDLSCPCSTASIPYSEIVSIDAQYHPICSLLINISNQTDEIALLFYTHHRLLRTLCNLTKNFIDDQGEMFGTRQLISIEALTSSSFQSEIDEYLHRFLSQTSSDYRRSLSFVIGSFHVNQFLNLFQKNWQMEFTDASKENLIKTVAKPFTNSTCTCAVSSNCKERLIDQIFLGCFPFDGFRLSKYANLSLGRLNQQLFVQQWINQSFYEHYFRLCRPQQCQYTIDDKKNITRILTTLLGIYGGLTYFLHLIIGQSLLVYRWWRKKRGNANSTIISNHPQSI